MSIMFFFSLSLSIIRRLFNDSDFWWSTFIGMVKNFCSYGISLKVSPTQSSWPLFFMLVLVVFRVSQIPHCPFVNARLSFFYVNNYFEGLTMIHTSLRWRQRKKPAIFKLFMGKKYNMYYGDTCKIKRGKIHSIVKIFWRCCVGTFILTNASLHTSCN